MFSPREDVCKDHVLSGYTVTTSDAAQQLYIIASLIPPRGTTIEEEEWMTSMAQSVE